MPFASRRFLPTLADVFVVACFVWLVASSGQGSEAGLLQDGDTGVHVRTGMLILDSGRIPYADPYSWSKPGAPWIAWEWLSDLVFALAFRAAGLTGVVAVCASVIALTVALLVRKVAAAAENALVALGVLGLVIAAMQTHLLARPHVFTLLFFVFALSEIEKPRSSWTLPLLTVLWVNMHGGIFAWLITLAILGGSALVEKRFTEARRLGMTLLLCLCASLLNPFGYLMHVHVLEYLRSGWIRENVAEFRPLDLSTEAGSYFEFLLFASVLAVAGDLRQRRFSRVLPVIAWGHAALMSARHVPLLAVVAAPALAQVAASCWQSVAQNLKSLDSLGADYHPTLTRHTGWALVLPLVLVGAGLLPGVHDYPSTKYPVDMVRTQNAALTGTRLFTLDEWADYLIFHLHPHVRVFLDGRSDFYGERIVEDYKMLLAGAPGWQSRLDDYGTNMVLLPKSALMVEALKQDESWQVLAEQDGAILIRRRDGALTDRNGRH